jgi:uncharacterized membrane protein
MAPEKMTRVFGILLFLSLAGNFLMGGVLLGKSYSQQKPVTHAEWRAREAKIRDSLSETDRKHVQQALDDSKPVFEKLHAQMDNARRRVMMAAKADPFDQSTLDAAMESDRTARLSILKHIQETRQRIMAGLSDEGRRMVEKLSPSAVAGPQKARPPVLAPADADEHMPFLWEEDFAFGAP